MAPVPPEVKISYIPLVATIGHLAAVVYLTLAVSHSLYRSYLVPSQVTRSRKNKRAALVPVFATLAAGSFLLAGYSSSTYARLSYKAWAGQRGYAVPTRLYGDKGIYGENATDLYLSRWLSDTPVYLDAFEIVAEKARRFWWGQQIDLAALSWTLLLSIEGRRRHIPHLWAYLGLAHLVSLSFAQNLFYLALVLTPLPIPADPPADSTSMFTRIRTLIFPPKPANWCPHPFLFLLTYLFNFAALATIPYAASTSSFANLIYVTRVFTFFPLLIPEIVPESWGTVHPHPHNAYSSFTDLFRLVSCLSFILHGKATVLGLLYNAPDAHYHRHSNLLPFDIEKRGGWERTTTALGRLLAATSDHPVVGSVGFDVVLSAISLGVWSAVRALDVNDILTSALPFYQKGHSPASARAPGAAEETTPDAIVVNTEEEEGTVKRRGRKPKASAEEPVDPTSTASTRKRGRPRKIKADPEEVPGDATYAPTPTEAMAVVEGDVLPDGDLDWETTALTWALAVVGGLGCASAGVFGGECISR